MSQQEHYEEAFPHTSEAHRLEHPTYISYGLNFEDACARHVEQTFKAWRVYVIVSKSLSEKTDNLQKLKGTLKDRLVGVHLGIPSHTPLDVVLKLSNEVKRLGVDCIITLGGGSLTDGAKAISYVAANDVTTLDQLRAFQEMTEGKKYYGPPHVFYDNAPPAIRAPTIPVICVPTTLSGGEYSRFAGCTDPASKVKMNIMHPNMNPRLVILDPTLSLTTPEWVWLSTGVRAIDHCIEALCSSEATPEVDASATKGLRRLSSSLLRTKADHDDLHSRLDSQLGTRASMFAVAESVNMGASHGIGHQLGPFGVGHGQTSCILLPTVVKYNSRVTSDKQQLVKSALWDSIGEALKDAGLDQKKNDAGDALDVLFRKLGMPRSLKEVGVGKDKLESIAENSLHDFWLATNPVPLRTKEQVLEVLNMVAE